MIVCQSRQSWSARRSLNNNNNNNTGRVVATHTQRPSVRARSSFVLIARDYVSGSIVLCSAHNRLAEIELIDYLRCKKCCCITRLGARDQ